MEGITDYWIFKAINDILTLKKMNCLRNDVIIIPAGGTKYLMPLASMLMGHNIKIAAILDGDNEGRNKGKQFQDKFFSGKDKKCLFVGDYSDNCDAEMEDLFPEDFYLKAVKEYYKVDVIFTSEEKKIKNITKRVSEAFTRMDKEIMKRQ